PKGVMWRLHDLIAKGNYGANPIFGTPPLDRPEDAGQRALASPIKWRSLVAPPLMHGTGLLSAFMALGSGGTVILLPTGKFSPEEMLDTAARHRATRWTIVGEPFARPILDALEANPDRWDLSSVLLITSSGAMWTRETKMGLIRHMPQVNLYDSYSSSEALGMGLSITNAQGETQTARFAIGETCAVFTEDHKRVEPGSGEKGLLAVGGFNPVGYYKDEEKTAKTFPVIDGERWCMPGDWALVNADGSLEILGRGSQCINTGGEKVVPEEVEEALRRHEAVRDVAVTGLPDPKWGERICAVIELEPGAGNPGEDALRAHVRTQLADYKVPRDFVLVDSVGRAPNGKLDYKAVKQVAMDVVGADAA
ncbi:MAG: AMP-binding protein, partial [Parasphingopyxis sp.]